MVDTLFPANAVSGAPNYSGRQLRQTNAASLPMGDPTRPLGGLSGVRSGTSTTTVTATSTTWTCGPFAGSADVMTASESGPYEFAFDANATGSVDAADASNPRTDIVYVQITDPEDGSTQPKAERKYLAGTPGATPNPPATPARSFVLAQLNVPKAGGGSPTVTWVAWGVTPGAVQIPTWGDMDSWTPGSDFGSPMLGMRVTVYADPTPGKNLTYEWNGSVWFPTSGVAPSVSIPAVAGHWLTGTTLRATILGNQLVCHFLLTKDSAIAAGETILTFPDGFHPFDDYAPPAVVVTGGFEALTYLVVGTDGILKVGAIAPNASARSIRVDFRFDLT